MENARAIIIDSSVLIAFYNAADAQHSKALVAAKGIIDKTIYLHPFIIQEVVSVLTYKFGAIGTRGFINNILNSEDVITQSWVDVEEEINFFVHLDKKISLADSAIIRMSKDKNIPVLTFDKQILSILNKLK